MMSPFGTVVLYAWVWLMLVIFRALSADTACAGVVGVDTKSGIVTYRGPWETTSFTVEPTGVGPVGDQLMTVWLARFEYSIRGGADLNPSATSLAWAAVTDIPVRFGTGARALPIDTSTVIGPGRWWTPGAGSCSSTTPVGAPVRRMVCSTMEKWAGGRAAAAAAVCPVRSGTR